MQNPARQSAIVWPPLPGTAPGMRIGLYGGSFNPPHEGHTHVSDIALKRLQLDRLWWLVTPGNPLKSHDDLAPLDERMATARALTGNPRIEILSIEADIGVSRSLDTVRWLQRRLPSVRFIWVMGADNLAGFHRWHGWRQIAGALPVAVIDRPGYAQAALASPAARKLDRYRLAERDAPMLGDTQPPAWVFLHGPLNPLSSTLLRMNGAGEASKTHSA